MKYQWGNHYFRHNGAGEMLTFLVADFEDFRLPRSDLPAEMEDDLEGVSEFWCKTAGLQTAF